MSGSCETNCKSIISWSFTVNLTIDPPWLDEIRQNNAARREAFEKASVSMNKAHRGALSVGREQD